MIKLLALMIIIFLAGCEQTKDEILSYKCSSEQLKVVKQQFDICNASSYVSSFCYKQAKMTLCDKIELKQSENDE